MQLMLATDMCRLLLREQPPALLTQLQERSAAGDEIIISSITYAELVAGAMLTVDKARHMELVKAFCERLDAIVAWDSGAVDAYSDLQSEAMNEGRSLNMNDAMLAAHAISLQASLFTANAAAFRSMKKLRLDLHAGQD